MMSQEKTMSHLMCLVSCLSQGYVQFKTREIWLSQKQVTSTWLWSFVTEGDTQHKRIADKR